MTSNDRGCVKTHRADAPSNIDLSERSVFDYFSLRKGKRTPETETALRFYTASTRCGPSASRKPVAREPVRHHEERLPYQSSRNEAMRFQSLYAMASISILVPTMFFACNVEREGLFPGKNSA